MRNGMIIHEDGAKRWYRNDELHRDDGPAVERASGSKYWYQNNQLHRIDGPAVEHADGHRFWYQNNRRHRIDGPAIEWHDGTKDWYFKGVAYDFNDWLELVTTTEAQKTMMRLQHA